MWDGWTPFTWGQGNYVSVPNYAGFIFQYFSIKKIGWDVQKQECPIECVFTVDRNYLHNADALLFDVCLTGPREYRET